MSLPRPDAVLFDLDGTLVDSLPTLTAVMNTLLRDHGRPALEEATIRTFVGDGVTKLVERSLDATGGVPGSGLDDAVALFLARYEAAPASGTVLRDGCVECLAALGARGIGLAICTNKPERVTRMLLRDLGLEQHFAAIIGGDTCHVRKPDAEPAREACRRLAVAPERTVFVGDNEHDAACGRAAGCAGVILVSGGYPRVPLAEIGADRIVHSLREIPALFA